MRITVIFIRSYEQWLPYKIFRKSVISWDLVNNDFFVRSCQNFYHIRSFERPLSFKIFRTTVFFVKSCERLFCNTFANFWKITLSLQGSCKITRKNTKVFLLKMFHSEACQSAKMSEKHGIGLRRTRPLLVAYVYVWFPLFWALIAQRSLDC